MKTLLLTGAGGFIGRNVIDFYESKDVNLILVDTEECIARHQLNKVTPLETIDWDTWDKPIDGIIHLGAISDTTCDDWSKLLYYNVEASLEMVKLSRRLKVPLVYASSAAVYGDGQQGYSDEQSKNSVYEPLNLYGKSKLEADKLILDQLKSDTQDHSIYGLRFFNVYGPYERRKASMASVISQAYAQITKTGRMRLFKSYHPAYADGGQQRDFVFVGDVIRVIDFLLESKPSSGIYNVGTGEANSFKHMIELVFDAMQREVMIDYIPMPESLKNQYQYHTASDNTKLVSAGFQAGYTHPSLAIHKTIEAYNQGKV
ncbi:MAG: ADP-glyceromanno-heptose 6-epimerase [Bacteroidota bacterium]|nr:ADP-glyceromanno-heptose 6-epimerase [Bacteroidota bacterium]